MTDSQTGKQYLVLDTDDLVHDVIQQRCHSYGGFLPEPRNEQENKFIHDLATGAFMLGMTDKQTEGRWVWDSDGSQVNWLNWVNWKDISDEPNGGDAENCAIMVQDFWNDLAGHKTDGWADHFCNSDEYVRTTSKAMKLICERHPGWFT